MKKGYSFGLVALFVLVLALALTGCGGGGHSSSSSPSTPSTPTPPTPPTEIIGHITFICQATPNAAATAFKNFLQSAGYAVNVIGIGDILTTDFSGADLIIVGNIPVDWGQDYPNQATAIHATRKPLLCLKDGSILLDTAPFAADNVFVSSGHTGSWDCNNVRVDDATSPIWNTPNALNVSTNDNFQVYSVVQTLARGIFWNNPPASAQRFGSNMFWAADYNYAVICYDVQNGVNYGFWGFGGPPAQMTSNGQKLFLNFVRWLSHQAD